LAFLYC